MSGRNGIAADRLKRAALQGAAAIALAHGLAVASPAMAQEAAAERTVAFDIPAGSVSDALRAFADVSGLQLVYNAELDTAGASPGASGSMAPREALSRLLAGTGLSHRFVNATTVTIESAVEADGARVLGAVRVQGAQGDGYFGRAGQAAGVNGVNGSRDITATEGTGSFTSGALTIGSKAPQAIKDVPQSVSVLTSERLEQQNVTDFTTAMKQLPGVTLVQGSSSIESKFYSRGYEISNIQVDGGAPLSTAYGFYPQIDMSIYDHVELLRGAAGQFGAYGNPGGTVNLVRKRPLDHAQFTVEAQAGSWSNYRVVADATSPLALDGKLRGRLVMTYQDNHYFYDIAKDSKTLIYGIAELDLTPTTLVGAGISYTSQDSVPWYNGLPRYRTGADLELPRSTALAFPWNRWDFDTTEFFGSIEQKIGETWTAKLNLTHNRQASARKLGYSYGEVNPLNDLGPSLRGLYTDLASTQFSAEATFSGAFIVYGQRQEVTAGINRVSTDGGGQVLYSDLVASSASAPYQPYPGGPRYCFTTSISAPCPSDTIAPDRPPINVFDFDPTNPLYTEPRNSLPRSRYNELGQVQTGAYINLRLTAFDRLHLTTGLRWSRYEYQQDETYFCVTTTGGCSGKAIGDIDYSSTVPYVGEDFSWPPPVSLSFDLTKKITVYLGYTDIYRSQAYYFTADHNPLPPITGSNWEVGAKWAARDGRFNLSLSAYRIQQDGFGIFDQSVPFEQIGPGVYCCYLANASQAQKSEGIDLEATGEILPGWQIAASYTYNENKYEGSSYGSDEGLPLVSIAPKHLYKLWMSYDFGAADSSASLSGLTISGGVNGQSSGYYAGSACKSDFIVTNPLTGAATCPSKVIGGVSVPGSEPYSFTVPPYAVFSARIDYRFSEKWSLAVNLENIFDKTYYQTVGNALYGGNWYGAPRSVTASLRARW